MRDSIIFYRSFYEAIKNLPRDVQGEIYTAIMEYGLYGNETENLKPVARSIFTLIKPQIEINNKRYSNGCKSGNKVPNTNQEPTKDEPNANQTRTKDEPNVNQTLTKQEPKSNQTSTKDEPNEDQTLTKATPNDNDNDIYKKETIPKGIVKKEAAKAATLSRKEEFLKSLSEFVDLYGQEMIDKFSSYWTEMNRSCTKMRFEQQPTWELSRRLSTWASRENNFIKTEHHGTNWKNYTQGERAADAASLVADLLAEDEERT